jgi:hypothetical protein
MRRTLLPLATVALITGGCGSSAPPKAGSTGQERGATFSACMRKNGVRAFPDPDASGQLTIDGVLNGSSLDPDSAAWKHAIAACKDLQPSGFTGHKATPQQQGVRLRFAQCIRNNGVKDFPDPADDAPLVDTNIIPSANQPGGMTVLNAAMAKCGDLAKAAIGGQG